MLSPLWRQRLLEVIDNLIIQHSRKSRQLATHQILVFIRPTAMVRNQCEPPQPWRSSQPFAQHHVINRSEYKTETAQKLLAVVRARVVAFGALIDCVRAFLQ